MLQPPRHLEQSALDALGQVDKLIPAPFGNQRPPVLPEHLIRHEILGLEPEIINVRIMRHNLARLRRTHIGHMVSLLLQARQHRASHDLIANGAEPAKENALPTARIALPHLLFVNAVVPLLVDLKPRVFVYLPTLFTLHLRPAAISARKQPTLHITSINIDAMSRISTWFTNARIQISRGNIKNKITTNADDTRPFLQQCRYLRRFKVL